MQIADLTYWLPYRKGLTDRFMPPMQRVKDLYHKRPFWYPFRFTLAAQKTMEYRQTARRDFRLVTLCATANVANAFSVQIYDQARRKAFSRLHVAQQNFAGTAGERYWIRYPYLFKAGSTIMVQVRNLTNAQITAEMVLEGVDIE